LADEDTSDAPTQLYEKSNWLKPAPSVGDLPTTGVKPGTQCFVTGEGEIYVFVDGAWHAQPDDDDEDDETEGA
jgi:hypothetical protein